jgi:hypothetical protein
METPALPPADDGPPGGYYEMWRQIEMAFSDFVHLGFDEVEAIALVAAVVPIHRARLYLARGATHAQTVSLLT